MGCDKLTRDTPRLDTRFKPQATSFKRQATSFKRQAATFCALRCQHLDAMVSSQQKEKICQNLHLSLTTKNLKWRILLTNMVSRTTQWEQPTAISTCLKELGSNELTMSSLGSGTEETPSINQHGPGNPGASIMHPIPKPQAASLKLQAAQGASGKRQA